MLGKSFRNGRGKTRRRWLMKAYDVYVPLQSEGGAEEAGDRWAWLEKLLRERFGGYTQTTGYHEGAWNGADVNFQGKVRAYSVRAEEGDARRFFKQLKQRVRKMGLDDILVVEKEPSGPREEPAGERI
jgi:hypothetical protein